jgi:DNA-directed RNA polymerase subunit H (RpoH/RPB5)
VCIEIIHSFGKSKSEHGESVGLIAGFSLGQPTTQMTLNTFQSAGVSAKDVTLGLPWLKELINASENQSRRNCTIPLADERLDDVLFRKSIVSGTQHTPIVPRRSATLNEIIAKFGDDSEKLSLAKTMFYVREMLRDRKFKTIPPLDLDAISFDDRYENNFISYKGEGDRNGDCVHVYFPREDTLGIAGARNIAAHLEENNLKHIIVIIKSKISSSAQGQIRSLQLLKNKVEIFFERELQYNLTKHSFVPEHTVCSEATKKQVLKEYNITVAQMIKIQTTDPVVRWLGAQPGQLLKIRRPSVLPQMSGMEKFFDISYAIVYENHVKTNKGSEKKKTQRSRA